MKRIGGILLPVVIALSGVMVAPPGNVAAACANVSSYGAVTMQVPVLPNLGDYAVWVRLQGPTTGSARVLLEANNDACLDIGGSSVVDQWVWHAYRQGDKIMPLKFPSTIGNTIKVIGVQAGVKVDKVLLTKPDCVPIDLGTNCANAIELRDAEADDITVLPPPSQDAVSGKIFISTTPERFAARLSSVTYTVKGRVVQKASFPEPFDTTLVANGKHTVLIETSLMNGQVIKESAMLEVDNLENPLSPVIRWARINQQSLLVAGGISGAVIVFLIFLWMVRRAYRRSRELKLHGF